MPGQKYEYVDSILSQNDRFEIKIPLNECRYISLEKKGSKKHISFLGIPDTHYVIEGDTNKIYNSSIKGSQEFGDYMSLIQGLKKLKSKNSIDSNALASIEEHIRKYNLSSSALFAMSYISRMYPSNVNLRLIKQLDPIVQETEQYKIIINTIDNLPFNNWNQNLPKEGYFTINNDQFNWDTLKDKYTFISFWASYCGPFLAEIPELQKLIKTFKVNFISISLDNDKLYWLNTINRTNYPGIHINNFKSFKSPMLEHFKIKSIPQIYLLDNNLKPIESDGSLSDLLRLLNSRNEYY